MAGCPRECNEAHEVYGLSVSGQGVNVNVIARVYTVQWLGFSALQLRQRLVIFSVRRGGTIERLRPKADGSEEQKDIKPGVDRRHSPFQTVIT